MHNIFFYLRENKVKITLLIIVEMAVLLQGVYCYIAFSASKSVLFMAFFAIILIGIFAVFLLCKSKLRDAYVSKLFLTAVFVIGLFYLIIFPPNSVPDEIFHFQASYKYSDVILGEEVNSSEITIRNEDKVLFEDQRTSVSLTHYREVINNFSLFALESGSTVVTVESSFNVADNPPQTKIASAFGITLGRLLGFGAYPVYYLGRLFSLITFALLVYFAVRITPVGKNIFMAVALLPMTLHLAASYSYDPAIIGLGFLLTALCLKAIYEKGIIEKKLLIGIGLLIFLITPCKVVYSFIALLVLLIPKERFSSRKMHIAVKGGLLLIGILGVIAFKLPSLTSLTGVSSVTASAGSSAEQLDIRGNETGHYYTLSDVFADPIGIILLYISSFGDVGYWYVETAIGSSLGWFQDEIVANDLIPISFIIILLIASLRSSNGKIAIFGSLRVLLIVIVFTVWVSVSASMLLGHTFVGEPHIMGIQGRYILPVLPLLLLALQNNKVIYQGNPVGVILICSFSLNLLYMNYVFARALLL